MNDKTASFKSELTTNYYQDCYVGGATEQRRLNAQAVTDNTVAFSPGWQPHRGHTTVLRYA
ncbi:MAG: hypothetical protein O3A47_02985 [Chloroflexi bacterium]|nr:hypothetical protein [Chloroflexota bacterium]